MTFLLCSFIIELYEAAEPNPPSVPHLEIAADMITATEVGGDYYDFHVDIDGTLTVVIGDATGHGMKAGTMVTAAKSIFNSYVNNPDIIFTFQEFNRVIKGMPLGAVNDFPYQIKTTELKSGDTLLLLSDGLPELFNGKKEMFGYDRVTTEYEKVASNNAKEIIEHLKNVGSEWLNGDDPDDDITFVVLKMK